MLNFIGGTEVKLMVPLMGEKQPSIPDVGSVKYTILGHSGVPLAGHQNVAVVTTSATTFITITIPDSVNTIAAGKLFERRTVWVSYTAGGKTQTVWDNYRIVPFLNIGVTPEDVRNYLGVNSSELKDEHIDLFAAYLTVQKELDGISLVDALSEGTTREISANLCIKLRTVIDLLPSLKQRMAQSQSNGLLEFARPKVVELEEIEYRAWEAYEVAFGEVSQQTVAQRAYVVVTQDVDPITNGQT